MKKYLSFMAFAMIAMFGPVLTGCNSKSANSQNEQTNIDSIVNARIEQKIGQQREMENQLKKEPEKPSYKQFVGTYKFDYCEKDGSLWNCPPIIVLEDGRCIIVNGTAGGGKAPKYLGDVNPISETAFRLSGDYKTFILDVELYSQNEYYGYTTYQYKWKTRDVVFDIAEGRLYRDNSQYRNRDIEKAVYTTMTHSNSTAY